MLSRVYFLAKWNAQTGQRLGLIELLLSLLKNLKAGDV